MDVDRYIFFIDKHLHSNCRYPEIELWISKNQIMGITKMNYEYPAIYFRIS